MDMMSKSEIDEIVRKSNHMSMSKSEIDEIVHRYFRPTVDEPKGMRIPLGNF
jgi:hypothetical protein